MDSGPTTRNDLVINILKVSFVIVDITRVYGGYQPMSVSFKYLKSFWMFVKLHKLLLEV